MVYHKRSEITCERYESNLLNEQQNNFIFIDTESICTNILLSIFYNNYNVLYRFICTKRVDTIQFASNKLLF